MKRFNEKMMLFIILVIAFIVRIIFLSQPNFFFDEAFGAQYVDWYINDGKPLWTNAPHATSLTPFLISIPIRLLGSSEFSVRIDFVIFGTLSIILVYLLGKEWYDKKNGILAAFLLALSPLHVIYSRLDFGDIPQTFFILGAILSAERFFKTKDKRFIIFSAVLFSFAFLIKMTAVIIWGIYWIFIISYALFMKDKALFKKSLFYLVIINLIAFLLIALITIVTEGIPRLIFLIYSSVNWIFGGAVGGQVTYPFYYYFIVMFDGLSPLVYFTVPVAIICLIYAIWKKRNRNDMLLIFIILVYLAIITFIQTRRYPRYLILVTPFLMILVTRFSLSLIKIKRIKKYALFLIFGLISSSFIWTNYEIIRFNKYTVWRDVGDYLNQNYPESKVFVSIYDYYPLMYYLKTKKKEDSWNVSKFKEGDLVVLSRVYANSTLTNSPFENDFFPYLSYRGYQINREYYDRVYIPYVKNNGILLKTFKNWGTDVVWVYKIKSAGNLSYDYKEQQFGISRNFIMTKIWDFICDGKLFELKKLLGQYKWAVEEKCLSR